MNFLHNNRLFKIVGIFIIIYLSLFANDYNPSSLGNRLSSERLKEEISDAQEKGKFIISNVKTTQNLIRQAENDEKTKRSKSSKIDDFTLVNFEQDIGGENQNLIACGDEVLYLQEIYIRDRSQIISKTTNRIIIGNKNNPLIEKALLGSNSASKKTIHIFSNYRSSDDLINDSLVKYHSDLKIVITVFETKKSATKIDC